MTSSAVVVVVVAAVAALALLAASGPASAAGGGAASKVVFSLNAGGNSFTSSTGVKFKRDTDDVTKASPRGVPAVVDIPIRGADPIDRQLYTTERYAQQTFSYTIPRPRKDGEYTLVLFFSEVYFQQPNSKVFDVFLNRELRVVEDLDIFAAAGFGAAHNEYIPLTIKGNTVETEAGEADMTNDGLLLEFVKGSFDNPKVCGIALVRGSEQEARELFPITEEETIVEEDEAEDEEEEQEEAFDQTAKATPSPRTEETKKHLRSQKRRVVEEEQGLPLLSIGIAAAVAFGVYAVFMRS